MAGKTGSVSFPLSTKDAVERLGISAVRVRELLEDGKLTGNKIGRAWIVDADSVERRRRDPPRAGRPRTTGEAEAPDTRFAGSSDPDLNELRDIYLRCEKYLSGGYDASVYRAVPDERERRFLAHVTDFFLQEKQHELIARGVF